MIKKFYYLLMLVFVCGCFPQAAPPVTDLKEAHEKFIKITEEDTGIRPRLTEKGKTLWIYLPGTDPIIGLKASGQKARSSNRASEYFSLKYLDAYFRDNIFHIEYDIAQDTKYDKNFGYASTYTDGYQKKQRAILYNIQRAYGDLEKVPGDVTYKNDLKDASHKELVSAYVKTAKAPVFFVFVIADIQRGIEAETIVYHPDIQKILSPVVPMPAEESSRRYLVDIRGDNAIINDAKGKHLDYQDLTLAEFLAEQIVNRVNFRYTRSSFPPSGLPADTILSEAVKTLDLYKFTDYSGVRLHNLATGAEDEWGREDLKEYRKEKTTSDKTKYHVIQFNANQE
jgi:hypothetical protein